MINKVTHKIKKKAQQEATLKEQPVENLIDKGILFYRGFEMKPQIDKVLDTQSGDTSAALSNPLVQKYTRRPTINMSNTTLNKLFMKKKVDFGDEAADKKKRNIF